VNIEEADALARVVDIRVLQLADGLDPARAFGVRRRGDHVVLVPFWSGVARDMPRDLTPPDDCCAIALETGGWAAPMDEGWEHTPPSLHPSRRRMHQTVLVYGDGVDVSVLRYDDEPPQVLRGGVGVVLELMLACWARRREVRQ
jgi:hypothetical protein